MIPEQQILSVTEITRRIKQCLESGFVSVCVQGQLSNFKRHTSGHLYFTLKDEGAQISAVLWRSRAQFLSFDPEDGMKVMVTGRLTVYEVRGNYQIEVGSIRPLGVGELQMAFENLKRKLAAEGLFDSEHKKPLPEFPERIGVVTSPTGAALHDILNVLRRRFPGIEVILRPVRVQGPGASEDLARAIQDFNKYGNVDVLVIARGGGSLEDLWAFNEEIVARAIYASKIPTVSAVGHEIDYTISDFVADLRAPTPSAAAELIVRDRAALLDIVRGNWYTLNDRMLNTLRYRKENILHLLKSYSFNRPIDQLRQFSQQIDELERSMAGNIGHMFEMVKARTASLRHRIQALNPHLVLKRGYTIVQKDGKAVGSSRKLESQDSIEIKFHDGIVPSTVA